MKKTTAITSLLLLGGFGSLGYWVAKLADLDLTFHFADDNDSQHYC